MKLFGKGWAQPVIRTHWAFICSVLFAISRLSGYRVLNHEKHVAWGRACGVSTAPVS